MLQKIEEINLLKLMKDIKKMISEGKLELKNQDYEIKLSKSDNVTDLKPMMKLLDIMVREEYLAPEIYFENEADFEGCFNIKYEDKLNEIFHSIRIEEIKIEQEDTYNGTFIYYEIYGGKLKFELACIKYLLFIKEIDNRRGRDAQGESGINRDMKRFCDYCCCFSEIVKNIVDKMLINKK